MKGADGENDPNDDDGENDEDISDAGSYDDDDPSQLMDP
jgi:hypothetical protein